MNLSADKMQIVAHTASACSIYFLNTQAAGHLLDLHLLPDGTCTQGFISAENTLSLCSTESGSVFHNGNTL